jgi:hypothetical protein
MLHSPCEQQNRMQTSPMPQLSSARINGKIAHKIKITLTPIIVSVLNDLNFTLGMSHKPSSVLDDRKQLL